MKKQLIVASLIAALTGGMFTACNSKSEKPAEAQVSAKPEQAEVLMILKTLSNPFWVSMKEGIEKEAAAKGVKVDILAANAENDTEGQLKLFENALTKNYKAIGIAPLSPVNVVPAVAEANKKGIYVINIDEKLDMGQLKSAGGSVIAFVTTDNTKVGGKGAQYIIDQLKDGGQVAIIEGQAGNASGENRKDGATAAFKADSKFELVSSQPADWDRSKALNITANLLQRYPNLKAIYACNDTMALGALQGVINANKLGEIIVVGTDGAPEARDSIKEGKLSATVAQDPAMIGAKSLDLLLEAMQNKPKISPDTEAQTIPVESNLITKDK